MSVRDVPLEELLQSPASADDKLVVLYRRYEILRDLAVSADSAISHLRHRKTWPLDDRETDLLISDLRRASGQ